MRSASGCGHVAPLDPANGYGRDEETARVARVVKVSAADLPVFEEHGESAAAAATAVLRWGGVLAALDLFLLPAAVMAAHRDDVRRACGAYRYGPRRFSSSPPPRGFRSHVE